MAHLARGGVERFVLSLGYRADQVIAVAERLRDSFQVEWFVEQQPLGTGGAALFAMDRARLSEALVANADTLLEADLGALLPPLELSAAEHVRILVVPCRDGARFGRVEVHAGKATQFLPSGRAGSGLVNAGIYRVHRHAFGRHHPGQAFSFEADVMQQLAKQGRLAAAVATGTFMDIGTPTEYFRFCAGVAVHRQN